jgi:hypothetical protein
MIMKNIHKMQFENNIHNKRNCSRYITACPLITFYHNQYLTSHSRATPEAFLI